MTTHCSAGGLAYTSVWNESIAVRGANELASNMLDVLDKVIGKNPDATKLTLWSDSCVLQNRNNVMCFALESFLAKHPNLAMIQQRFGAPAHNITQEVDDIHSHIEKRLRRDGDLHSCVFYKDIDIVLMHIDETGVKHIPNALLYMADK